MQLTHRLYTAPITDLNECARNVDECDQNCHNILGSYTCTCNAGYTLSVDEFHCDGEY